MCTRHSRRYRIQPIGEVLSRNTGNSGSRLAKQPLHRTKSSSCGIGITEPNPDSIPCLRTEVLCLGSTPQREYTYCSCQDVGVAFVCKVRDVFFSFLSQATSRAEVVSAFVPPASHSPSEGAWKSWRGVNFSKQQSLDLFISCGKILCKPPSLLVGFRPSSLGYRS